VISQNVRTPSAKGAADHEKLQFLTQNVNCCDCEKVNEKCGIFMNKTVDQNCIWQSFSCPTEAAHKI